MLEIVEAKPMCDHRLYLRFNDGAQGELDIAQIVAFEGVFAALADQRFFQQVYVDADWGTVCWPGDLDLAPEPLWERIAGRIGGKTGIPAATETG
jgi:hypothetical protein